MKIGEFFDKLAGAKTPKAQVSDEVGAKEAPAKSKPAAKRGPVVSMSLTKAALAAAVIVVSFFAGLSYQKSRDDSTTSQLNTNGSGSESQKQNQNEMGNGSGGGSGFGNGSGGLGGGFGGGGAGFSGSNFSASTVTAISSSSISVKDSSGNSETYGITSDTHITDSGQQVSTSDIQAGDTVLVIPDREDTSTARRIIVNPDFNQNQGGSQPEQIDPGQTEVN